MIKLSKTKIVIVAVLAILGFATIQIETVQAANCITYNSQDSFTLNPGVCTPGTISTYRGTHCPTTERLVGTMPDINSGYFKAIPAAGECEQIDFRANDGSAGGGVCICYPSEEVTCYKCTDILNDGNACQTQQFQNTCPTGWSRNSNCAEAAGGSCAVEERVTCYICSPELNDGNMCVSTVFPGTVCPAGTSIIPTGCADAVGGSCASQVKTCYRCTDDPADGDMCTPFQINSTLCPAGTSEQPNGCAVSVGGHCSSCTNNICPPDTAIGDIFSASSIDGVTGNIFLFTAALGIILILNGKLINKLLKK